eukprot:10913144-Alexandrium_andersonii.AAC.1
MCGGLQGRATDVAAFHLRQFFKVARRSGRVAGALFVDVSGAFDAVIRQVVFGSEGSSPALA